jgi:heterotetrameric sarcosine oxidase gamma subunit
VPVGRLVYTPLLAPNGGFKADLTITRTGEQTFRVVTGGGDGARDRKWFLDNLPEDGSVTLTDLTSALATIGLWGPRARDVLQKVAASDVSDEAFPFGTAQNLLIGGVPAWAMRISYVGELGWEIYTPTEHGLKLWDTLWEAGQEFGIVPVGIGVYGNSGRLEKGYRLMSAELNSEYNPVEADLTRPKVKRAAFVGKQAYLKAREDGPAAILCTLTVDDHTSASGVKRYMQGREPVLTAAGEPIVDAHGRRSFVTSAGAGPSLGKHILLAYLPPDYAHEGSKLLVEYMTEQYPVTVARVGSKPLFDPDDERMKL